MIHNTIHHEIRNRAGLTMLDYCLLESIYLLSNSPKARFKGWCNASKVYFEYLSASGRTIINRYNILEKKGFLEFKGKNRALKRTTEKYHNEVYCYILGVKKFHPNSEKISHQDMKKFHPNSEISAPYNYIDKNSDKNKDKEKEKTPSLFSEIDSIPKKNPKAKNIPKFTEIVEHFKKITGRVLHIAKTESAIIKSAKYTSINARLKDGYTVEQAKMVIEYINKKWKDSYEMKDNINIETIFRQKNFEKYLDSALNQNLGPQTDKKKEKDNPATGFSLDNIQVNS